MTLAEESNSFTASRRERTVENTACFCLFGAVSMHWQLILKTVLSIVLDFNAVIA